MKKFTEFYQKRHMFKKRFGGTSSCNAASTACGGDPAPDPGCGGNTGCDGSGAAAVQEKPPSPKSRKELLARVSCVL